jgi:hypothetical protein
VKFFKLNGGWLIVSRFTDPYTRMISQVAEMVGILTTRAVSYPPERMRPVHLKSDARVRRFARQTYLTLAFYRFVESTGDLDAIEMARSCTHHLIKLRGPKGVWPWFFDARVWHDPNINVTWARADVTLMYALMSSAQRWC